MKRIAPPLAASALFALLGGCAAPVTPPTTFNFDLPVDMDMVCLNVSVGSDGHINMANPNPEPRPLADCVTEAPSTNTTINDMISPDGGQPGFTATRLFAVVTQRERGELAVVNLHETNDVGVVDNNRAVPGFTFITVGPVPGAVAVDPSGAFTFVANTGDNTVSVIDNRLLLSVTGSALQGPNNSGPVVYHFPSTPTDLAVTVSNGHTRLYVTVPNAVGGAGAVFVKDVTDPTQATDVGAPVVLASDSSRPAGGMDGGTMDGGTAGMDGGVDGAADGTADGGVSGAYPAQIVVAQSGQVYVADRHTHFIHVLSPDETAGLIESSSSLMAGVPTRALAVSPPAFTLPGMPTFVYAIDDQDGSVLVFDVAQPAAPLRVNIIADRPECIVGNPAFNTLTCPRIDPGELKQDRIPLIAQTPAISITFARRLSNNPNSATSPTLIDCQPVPSDPMSQAFRDQSDQYVAMCTPPTTDETPGPLVLRGLQAVITLRSGQFQVVDIEDPDRTCQTASRTTFDPATGHPRTFQPHIPRQANPFLVTPSLTTTPRLLLQGANIAGSSALPHLAPTVADPTCTPDPSNNFCCTAANNFCVALPTIPVNDNFTTPGVVDPLAVRDDTWTLTFQGILPNLSVDAANLVPQSDGTFIFDAPGTQFCTHGALAGDLVTLRDPSPFIVEPDVDAGLRPPLPDAGPDFATHCQNVFGTTPSPCNRAFQVLSATQDRMVLRHIPDPACQEATVDDITQCYPRQTPVDVRAGAQWVVTSVNTLYQSDVEVGADGNCVAAPERHFPTGRAVEGEIYQSSGFNVLIQPGQDASGQSQPTVRDTAIQFQTTGGTVPLGITGTLLPGATHYFCEDRRLYLVDSSQAAALVEYPVTPLASPRRFN